MQKKIPLILLFNIFIQLLFSQQKLNNFTSHPSWIEYGNIYEVNIRQYTSQGTFKAFESHLPRLKRMGVQTLWFMPINPISKVDRKGSLGSYYAVSNYTAINPEFGNMEDWKNIVLKAHQLGFKVVIDWVPCHTGADHYWLKTNKNFYELDDKGNPKSLYDWTDTRKLNYNNKVLQDSMIQAMLFWVKNSDIDGFRCDVAGEVPDDFWKRCISTINKTKKLFWLAEADKPSLHSDGFDATYGWQEFGIMKDIAKGSKNALSIDTLLENLEKKYPHNFLRLLFTSNHDENSWNKADFETMPNESHAPFAVLTQTMKNALPLIYSGQEEPVKRAISFFEKDSIKFRKLERHKFYATLLYTRKRLPFNNNAIINRIISDNKNIYAFTRTYQGNAATVIVNLSNTAQKFTLKNMDKKLIGTKGIDIFNNNQPIILLEKNELPAWGYQIILH